MFILLWVYLYFTFQVCPFFWAIVDKNALEDPFYFYSSFLVCFLISYLINFWKENFNNNKDILYKFISFLFKPFGYIWTFFSCEVKKFFNFLKNFKYKKMITIFYIFFLNYWNKIKPLWRPIFRRWSYFGYFRINKSKWINNNK